MPIDGSIASNISKAYHPASFCFEIEITLNALLCTNMPWIKHNH